jgi:hypothetical protein
MEPVAAGRVLSDEEMAALLAKAADFGGVPRGPMPAVLDTDFIRTGLHVQLTKGTPPKSVQGAQDGSVRLFMEYDTLVETDRKLPKFADQFDVSPNELRRVLNQDWLPHIEVVRLPPRFREVDPRALAVRDGDPGDYPAAALAALLSPCLLLTHNYRHFGALGVRTRGQSVDGVMAVVAIKIGEVRLEAAIWVPTVPFRAAGAATRWATDKIGPVAWVLLGLAAVGGIWWYFQQPQERRDQIKTVAGKIGSAFMDEYTSAAANVHQARLQLRASMVPKPEQRTPVSAIVRELALSSESLSAAQLAELLDPTVRPPVDKLRAFLRDHQDGVFKQVRRGGFVLGTHYGLTD